VGMCWLGKAGLGLGEIKRAGGLGETPEAAAISVVGKLATAPDGDGGGVGMELVAGGQASIPLMRWVVCQEAGV
jgi:hypothetical protein